MLFNLVFDKPGKKAEKQKTKYYDDVTRALMCAYQFFFFTSNACSDADFSLTDKTFDSASSDCPI